MSVAHRQGAAQEKTPQFITAVTEDEAAPIGVKPPTGVGMFIKMSAVKKTRAMPIGREMRRDPVQDDPCALLVEIVYEKHEDPKQWRRSAVDLHRQRQRGRTYLPGILRIVK